MPGGPHAQKKRAAVKGKRENLKLHLLGKANRVLKEGSWHSGRKRKTICEDKIPKKTAWYTTTKNRNLSKQNGPQVKVAEENRPGGGGREPTNYPYHRT